MAIWSLDLGTSNSTLGYWDKRTQSPKMVRLPGLCLESPLNKQIDPQFCIPSMLWLLPPKRSWLNILRRIPYFEKRFYFGKQALIGKEAHLISRTLENLPNRVFHFKPTLMRDPFRTMTHLGKKHFSASHVTRIFLRELFYAATKQMKAPIDHLIIGTPVNSYEPYRAELKSIVNSLGIKSVQFLDEPVAAALGYGLALNRERLVLVIDFGGGTLDLALVRMSGLNTQTGQCDLIAKEGYAIGGDRVDQWLLDFFSHQNGFELDVNSRLPQARWWHMMLLEEARRVKEQLYLQPSSHFLVQPPPELQSFDLKNITRGGPVPENTRITREDLEALLEERGLYRYLDSGLKAVMEQAELRGVTEDQIEEVLMVGGSTLLPGIYPRIEKRFGRGKVRAWQPFYSVAYGGAVFGSGRRTSDFIVHDYAIKTYHPTSHEEEFHTIVPKGTQIPSFGLWKKQLVPTCALGEPERIFKLIICELGGNIDFDQEFIWDDQGQLHATNDQDRMVVPLNESDPVLGYLDPPHLPNEKTPRLEVSFGVNSDRWLIATVLDLKTRKHLLKDEPVVKIK